MFVKFPIFFTIQFLMFLLSSLALGQNLESTPANDKINGVVTGNNFVVYYGIDPVWGSLTVSVKDGEFNNQLYEQFRIGKDFVKVNHTVDAEKVFLLLHNRSSYKIIGVIDTKKLDIKFYPITVSLGSVDRFMVLENTLLLVQSLEKGDFVQLYDYRMGTLISLSELYQAKTRIWDVQVKEGVFDILVHRKGDYFNQSLKMVGYSAVGTKLYETKVMPPGPQKLIFKSGKLISGPDSGYKIVGTYAKKQGEQFSGYYHVSISGTLDQEAKIHPMRSLDGFFDFKKNPGLRKNAKNLRRDMVVYHTQYENKYIALASSSEQVVRKFVHFILLDRNGERVYDTSVKVFYDGEPQVAIYSALGLKGKDMYFLFEGNPKMDVLPGMKVYQIENGKLTGLLKLEDFLDMQRKSSDWEDIMVYHWKENKFVVLGIELVNGQPQFRIRKIEV